jgi:hypothetical protein
MRCKSKLFTGVFTGILQFVFLIIPSFGIVSAASQDDFTVYSSGLGNVYGIAFDANGNLFATGTVQEKVVLWKIGKDGQKSEFSELRDDVDALGKIGVSNHSKNLTNLTVDGHDNVWVVSSKHGACFIASSEGEIFKVYLNKDADSPLYLLASTGLYEVQFGGNLKRIGNPFNDLKPFSGTVIDETIYFSAEDNNGQGYIYQTDNKGNKSVFAKGLAQPRGLTYREGFLYIADSGGGRILKKRIIKK